MLNLRDALRLVAILDPYIPSQVDLDSPILDFVGRILQKIVEDGKHTDYLAATEIISGIPIDDLVSMSIDAVFTIFTNGLLENKVLMLVEFYRGIGNKVWQTKPL